MSYRNTLQAGALKLVEIKSEAVEVVGNGTNGHRADGIGPKA